MSRIRSAASNLFIATFSQWAISAGLPEKKAAALTAVLRRAIFEELPSRDRERNVFVRPLSNAAGLRCRFESADVWLYPTVGGRLVAGAVAPAWRAGWREISKHEDIRDVVSDFFWSAGQYVARSRMATVIGAISLSYDRACDFRYEGLSVYAVGGKGIMPTVASARSQANEVADYAPLRGLPQGRGRRERALGAWVSAINALDPYIHRAVFKYWRAVGLRDANFWEESITALDSVTSVAAQYIGQRLRVAGNARQALASVFGMSQSDARLLDELYKLRCDYGAHPGHTLWWDFSEVFERDIDAIWLASRRLLWRLCQSEQQHRRIDPAPDCWSDWFLAHGPMVLRAVWFV